MAYTKKDIAFTILKSVGGFSDDSDNDIREIYFHLDSIGDKVRYDMILEGMNSNTIDISSYLKIYKSVPTLFDSELDLYYSTLPASPINLPFGKGLWFISPMKDQNSPYIPRRSSAVQLTSVLGYSRMQGRNSYWREDGRVWYVNKPVESVLMKLIPVGENVEEDDTYPAPENIVAVIVEAVIARMKGKLPPDYLNDSNPTLQTR
jgi:hypothetical protein